MKTTPIHEILKQITPLPLKVDRAGVNIIDPREKAEYVLAYCKGGTLAEVQANAAYLTHAANVLPGLVEALGRAGDIARGDLLDGLHGESVSKDDFDAQLRNVRGIAMSLEAILSNALTHATSVPVNS